MTGRSPASLDELEARLRQDLRWLNLPPNAWEPPRQADGGRVLDVAIIGGGLCGLAALAALKFLASKTPEPSTARRSAAKVPGSPMPAWKRCAPARKRPAPRSA